MYFTKSGSFPEALTSVVDDHHSRGMLLQVLVVGSEAALGSVRALPDADGHVRQCYGVAADGAAYLVRPDQHICARWLTLDADRLQCRRKHRTTQTVIDGLRGHIVRPFSSFTPR